MIIANFISRSISTLNPDDFSKVMLITEAPNPNEAYKEFIKRFGQDVRLIQIFHNNINIVEIPETMTVFKLSETYGQLAKFPNYDILEDESILKF